MAAKPDAAGFLHVQGKGRVSLTLGEPSVDRALAWLARFIQAAEALGYGVRRTDAGLVLHVDGEAIGFRLKETPRRTPHQPTAQELARKADRVPWGLTADSWPLYDYAPSGDLALVIEGNSYSGLRRSFADGKTRRLENLIDDVLTAFAAHAALHQDNRRKAETARLEREAAEARRREIEAFDRREARRLAVVDAIHEKLAERDKLAAVLMHIEVCDPAERGRLDAMAAWLRGRLSQIEALLGPVFLDISARHCEVDFDEARAAAAKSDGGYHYYARTPQLWFWSIDDEKGLATSQSAFEWAAQQKDVNALEPDEVI